MDEEIDIAVSEANKKEINEQLQNGAGKIDRKVE